MCQVRRHVLGADDDHLVRIGPQHGRDVRAERRVAAFVRGDEVAVDPHLRAIVDRATVEQQPPAGILPRRPDGAPVPHDGMEAGLADAAGGRLGREGHRNGACVDVLARGPAVVEAASRVVVGEAPGASQIDPARPCQLRARVHGVPILRHAVLLYSCRCYATWRRRSPRWRGDHLQRTGTDVAVRVQPLQPVVQHCVARRGLRATRLHQRA